MIEWLIVFSLGLSLGSFGNNAISYFSNSMHFDILRSTCMCGKKKLKYYELIPLVSFLFLKGKCSYCDEPISKRYFLFEIFAGILGIICFEKYGLSFEFILYYLSFLIMLVIAVIDFSHLIIPNPLLSSLLIIAIINLFIVDSQVALSIIGAVILIIILVTVNLLYSKYKKSEAIGYGDIKYIGILTLLFTFPISLFGLWFSAFLAIPGFYIIKILFSNYTDEKKIPFALFLSFGYLITNLFDNWLISTYNNFISGY
ncbi:MAG: prepilin peptidase [Bacteroidetes bacterium]|nr:prepilin peptidase [Bacteroidota bacterium]MBU1797027.1 prepilin peptidase [Bacteroidota bacterium]